MSAQSLALSTVLSAVAALSFLGGCGNTEQVSQQTMSPEKFAKRADLICTHAANEQPELATAYLRTHPHAEEADLVQPAVIPPLEKMVKQLKALGLPRSHEAKAEAFLVDVEKALQTVKDKPAEALSERDNPFDKANHLGAELKLGDCSRNP